jgi:hypothetical protein
MCAENGLCVILNDSFFIVADVWMNGPNARQITLLHVPEGDSVDEFVKRMSVQAMAELACLARGEFSELCAAPFNAHPPSGGRECPAPLE